MASGSIMYLIHHIFLPPKLPHEDDFDPECETILLKTVIDGLSKFKQSVTCNDNGVIVDSVIDMVKNLKTVHYSSGFDGAISEEKLANALENLCNKGGTVPLHIRAQNTGVMISRVEGSVNVEAFELSPANQAVITSKGRLQRSFPGPALSLSLDTLKKPGLQAMIAETLAKMSHQVAAGTMPKVRKAGEMHDEGRDTIHPKLITELFMGVLRPLGQLADVSRLWKSTREEVMWYKSQLPWRRSPMWLLIRVVMQLVFSRLTSTSNSPKDLYKQFMVFLMADVLELSQQNSLPSDLLYAMNAKIARRLLKFDPRDDIPGIGHVQKVMRNSNKVIHSTWSSIMENEAPHYDLSRVERLNFDEDIFCKLSALDEYITSMAKRETKKSSAAFQPASALVKYQTERIPTYLSSSNLGYLAYNLRAFEDWVSSALDQWLNQHKLNTSTCGKLGDLIKSYHADASPFYSGNPEGMSTMLLTILELWIACDKSAKLICGLLRDYDPGVPKEMFQSLTLPFKCQMERLLRAEAYLDRRQARAKHRAPSIFRDFGLDICFSVKYFSQSPEHRALLETIESRANQARREKCNELKLIKERYNSLMRLHDQSVCEFEEVVIDVYNGFRKLQHSSRCQKCRYKSQAASLDIQIHEWPLPSDASQARSTVFELKVPYFFGCWRDTTILLLHDILKAKYLSAKIPEAHYPLNGYRGLSSFFTPFSSTQRIGLLSQKKPNESTHRRTKSIAVIEESDICLRNGLGYRYHDGEKDVFVENFRFTDKIPTLCTYKLPARSAPLQKFLFRPAANPSGPSPNTVIASQSDCPEHMSLDEYKAVSAIPLGYRIQWQNILVQLRIPSVDFKKVETSLIILQSIYQAGIPAKDNVLRSGHEILADVAFVDALLEALHQASQRVKENWESSQALTIFICLARRLLSVATTEKIRTKCIVFLASVRVVAFRWVNVLRDKAHEATDESQRKDFISKAVELALICVDSFNVDERQLVDALKSLEDASMFLQCSIFIQEGGYTISKTSDFTIHLLHWRWKCLSYRVYPILATRILNAGHGPLDDAIKKCWSAYQAGDGWQADSKQVDYWIISQTAPQGNGDSLCVHFNLLNGELLVNGLPLARLPTEYESHPTYRTLFGHAALEVMPTAVQGMQFSGKKQFAGNTLQFGIDPAPSSLGSPNFDLLVQAVKDDQKYELIPSRILSGEFPVSFVRKFVHWYDTTRKCLEFRPIEDPWTSSPDNWRLVRGKTGSRWYLTTDGSYLISVKSKTAVQLSGILYPLEDLVQIHMIFHRSSSSLEIELPRLQLGFHLKSRGSSILSKQFPGMAIDEDQSLGALVGLRNKMMLKHEKNGSRLVILPEGCVSYQTDCDHVRVTINKDSVVKAHAYTVDSQIGMLVDNGSLQSKLFLCYLHALTSFCLPDPLTRQTGTEQALSILKSAAVRSFDQLAQENVGILERIALLTPPRSYYPANEFVMQTVIWSPSLSFLAQHSDFYLTVRSIFDQAKKAKIFQPESYLQPPNISHVDLNLLERDRIRSSIFRVSGFGAEDHIVTHDVTYPARDKHQNSEQGIKAFVMSSLIYEERTNPHYNISSGLRSHLWKFLSKSATILGPKHPLSSSELIYDARLLLDSSKFLSENWSSLHRVLSKNSPRLDKFRLMIWLSTLAFAKKADLNVIQTLASFFVVPEMSQYTAPPIDYFELSQGVTVNATELRDIVRPSLLPFQSCPEAKILKHAKETEYEFKQRQMNLFRSNQHRALNGLTKALEAQWPCATPTTPVADASVALHTYMDMSKAIKSLKPKFTTWFNNYRFYEYLGQIENTLQRLAINPVEVPLSSFTIPVRKLQSRRGFVCVDEVLACPAPSITPFDTKNLAGLVSSTANAEKKSPGLAALIKHLEVQAKHSYEKNYVNDLQASLLSLRDWGKEYSLTLEGDVDKGFLLDHLSHCKQHVQRTYETILSAASAEGRLETPDFVHGHNSSVLAAEVGQWPRLSPVFFLQQLTCKRWQKLSKDWKCCIIHYGLALTEVQRAERLVSVADNRLDLIKELRNLGHKNWSPHDYPESLLLEVESGILIRDIQENIAREMRNPSSGANAVMQLNMGEGKSSVIVPIVALALANGSRLVRVIVAKPQSKQMFQTLVSKLGGLQNRRIYHMRFSRALRLGETEANALGSLYQECMTNGGILLVQPEHILSFKLMGLESIISGKEAVGRSLLSTQKFFDTSSRDIVDESDENFSVKFELVYTMGMQRPIEFSHERWSCIHEVLDLVKKFAPNVKKEFPLSIEVKEDWGGSFPRTRIFRPDAQQRIFVLIAESICATGLTGFPIARQPEAVRQAVFKYITELRLTEDEIAQVEKQDAGGFWADTTKQTLLLLRGLIAGRVLPFAFGQKRWKVNYGLDTVRRPRTKLAVPYRAKDSPAPRSEFSHPDVIIVLTSLTYYYGGLNDDDLLLAFDHLLKSDSADVEYQAWVNDAPSLPSAFRQLVGINLKDHQCIEQVLPSLRYAKSTVDYFLAKIVFPKEMKEFPHKLSASGWDIGQVKTHPTTGFSGTNDSRKTLPLSVGHLDLQEQKHTNALVLEYLLQPENSVELIPLQRDTTSSDAELLLAMVTTMKQPVQVILDVGAQILELSNLEVAREWLKMAPDRDQGQAVVFFNEYDELSVLDHKGRIEPLQISSFAKRLNVCLVYLDEAHTRGTDLRLPEYYRAAVTLGANLTKDRLVQACMRLRKLGNGQSVVFCVPEEIKTKILTRKSKPCDTNINVSDVLSWAISETCIDMRQSMPLWAVQGQRFDRQSTLWAEAHSDGKVHISEGHAKRFLENESQTLEDKYRPRPSTDEVSIDVGQNKNLKLIMERCREFDSLKFNFAELQEEQERELSPEIEQERQIQRPAPAQPAQHNIHNDLRKFVSTGVIINGCEAYKPAFEALRTTSAAAYLEVSQFADRLFATADFASTVQISGASYISDSYQRPVQWILTNRSTCSSSKNKVESMMIISPYEAQELLPDIKKSTRVALHLYAPRPSLAFHPLEGLDLYTVPSQTIARSLRLPLSLQLGLFSGQLYLRSFTEYVQLCDFLGLAWNIADKDCIMGLDGFILADSSGRRDCRSRFSRSPVKFLKVLMTQIRRNCEAIDRTHMGAMLDGRLLCQSDFVEPEDLVCS